MLSTLRSLSPTEGQENNKNSESRDASFKRSKQGQKSDRDHVTMAAGRRTGGYHYHNWTPMSKHQ